LRDEERDDFRRAEAILLKQDLSPQIMRDVLARAAIPFA
jgi:hypothetical protein